MRIIHVTNQTMTKNKFQILGIPRIRIPGYTCIIHYHREQNSSVRKSRDQMFLDLYLQFCSHRSLLGHCWQSSKDATY